MFLEDDKSTMEEIVKTALDEVLESSGVNEAVQAVQEMNEEPRMTKEEIMAVRNRRERQELIAQNMDLFEKK